MSEDIARLKSQLSQSKIDILQTKGDLAQYDIIDTYRLIVAELTSKLEESQQEVKKLQSQIISGIPTDFNSIENLNLINKLHDSEETGRTYFSKLSHVQEELKDTFSRMLAKENELRTFELELDKCKLEMGVLRSKIKKSDLELEAEKMKVKLMIAKEEEAKNALNVKDSKLLGMVSRAAKYDETKEGDKNEIIQFYLNLKRPIFYGYN